MLCSIEYIFLMHRKYTHVNRHVVSVRCSVSTHSHYRVAKTHKMPYVAGQFLQKSPISSGSFAKNDLQLKALMGLRQPVTCHGACEICTISIRASTHFTVRCTGISLKYVLFLYV